MAGRAFFVMRSNSVKNRPAKHLAGVGVRPGIPVNYHGLVGRGQHPGDAPDSPADFNGGGHLPPYRERGGEHPLGHFAGCCAARDRLLERDASASVYASQLAGLRAKTEQQPGTTEVAAAATQQPARGAVGERSRSLPEDRGAEFQQSPAQTKSSSWTMASDRRPCPFLRSPKSWGS
jgi:hypothetical protein